MTSSPESDIPPIPVISSVAPFADHSQAWLVDVWGVIHNGVQPFAGAVAACERFRETGGCVVLLSNSPRPRDGVIEQLAQVGVSTDAWDVVITSGDVSRELIHMLGDMPVYHLGPERDAPVFDGLGVDLVGLKDAGAIVCTGLFDDTTETPADYSHTLADLAERDIPMICANPDIKAVRGDQTIFCAGALAQLYTSVGGKVAYAGKPYMPIYHMAFARVEQFIGVTPDKARVLAVGDGVHTDIKGAANAGIRSVYISSGVHMAKGDALDQGVLDELFPSSEGRPVGAMTEMEW